MTELKLDEHSWIMGTVVKSDDSFDHEFGTEAISSFEIEFMSVFVLFDGLEHEITKCLSPEMLKYYRNKFLKHMIEAG